MIKKIAVVLVFMVLVTACGSPKKYGQYNEGLGNLAAEAKKYSKIRIRVHAEPAISHKSKYQFVKRYFEKKLVSYIKRKTYFKDVALVSEKDQGAGALVIEVKILDFTFRHGADRVGIILSGGLVGLSMVGSPEMRIYVLYKDGDSKRQLAKLIISKKKGTTYGAIRKLSTQIAIGLNSTGKSVRQLAINSESSE